MEADDARNTFPKVGDDSDRVVDTSGADWPGAEMAARPRTITQPRPGRALPHRRPTTIDAESGETLRADTERGSSPGCSTPLNQGDGGPVAPVSPADA